MKIGVYGTTGDANDEEINEKARELGREIAFRKHVLVTGGSFGIPYQSVLAAHENAGKTIAYSNSTNLAGHLKQKKAVQGFTEIIYVPSSYEHTGNPLICGKYRNVSCIAAVDKAIIIGGGIGTMNEFTIAYDFGKDIGILEGTGGITTEAIETLLKATVKKTNSRIIRETDPKKLLDNLL